MEIEKPSTIFCTVVAMDTTSFCYNVCSVCERALQGDGHCKSCGLNAFNPDSPSGSKLRYRVLLSIASGNKVFVVICFDRVARILFGCSANELFDFAKLNSFAAVTAGKILEGEMLEMTLSEPKNANAEHLRVTSVTPLRSDFCPAIETLRKLYGVGPSSSQPFSFQSLLLM